MQKYPNILGYFFHGKIYINFDKKMCCATFWAIFNKLIMSHCWLLAGEDDTHAIISFEWLSRREVQYFC
jgi:hypothetical protein